MDSTQPGELGPLREALEGHPGEGTWKAIVAALEEVIALNDQERLDQAFELAFDTIATWPGSRKGAMPDHWLQAWLEGDHRYTAVAELCGLNETKVVESPKQPRRARTFYRARVDRDEWISNADDPVIRLHTYSTSSYKSIRAFVSNHVIDHFPLGLGEYCSYFFPQDNYRNWLGDSPDHVEIVIHGKVVRCLAMIPDVTLRKGDHALTIRVPHPTDRDRVKLSPTGYLSIDPGWSNPGVLLEVDLLDASGEVVGRSRLRDIQDHELYEPFLDIDPEYAEMELSLERLLASIPRLSTRNPLDKDMYEDSTSKFEPRFYR